MVINDKDAVYRNPETESNKFFDDNAECETKDIRANEGNYDTLDLSCLDETEETFSANSSSDDGNTLYLKTLSLIESGEISLESGIMLLKKSANDGCALSWIYLGKLYSDEKSEIYNPVLACECFYSAAKLHSGEGYYNLGLCYSAGFGCEKSEEMAVDCFLNGAETDNPDCICALGICREFGIGCDIDYEMAVYLYSKAAEYDCHTAINNLGGCYYHGHGIEQDKEKAIELYKRAADLGNTNAECRLGICCELGDGCEKDPIAAVEHYKKSAAEGNETALYRMALCYDMGIGVEQDFAKAYRYYEQAAYAGNPEAMIEAGMMNKLGRGTKKDSNTAYKMFSLAAELGISNAQYELGNCYYSGMGTVRDREIAFSHYKSALETDPTNAKAALKIGICYLMGHGVERDDTLAYQWFSKASQLGSARGAYMQGECSLFGVGTEMDEANAVLCYEKALNTENLNVERLLSCLIAYAQCLQYGIGTEKNHDKALSCYKNAAEYGSAEAMYLTGCAIMTGVGIKAEYAAARIYILRAARKDYVPALLSMGIFAEEGKGIPKNIDDAIHWYAKAVESDCDNTETGFEFPGRTSDRIKTVSDARIEAMYRLGMLVVKSRPSTQSYIQAFEYISRAASMGYEPAQTEIAKIYVHGGDLKEYYESSFSNEDACFDNGELKPDKDTLAAAMNKLGDALFDGNGMIKKNEITAVRCYKTAAELGNNDACYSYGWCLRHGVGVQENETEAIKWLKLSADRGNNSAAYSYGLCCEEGYGTGIRNKREAMTYYRKASASGHVEATKRYNTLSGKNN